MSCVHCLRGDAENLDMTDEILQAVLKPISNITTISFTGGEPSLNIPFIEQALQSIKEKKIPIYSCFIATNGMSNIDDFLNVCDQWHYYTMSCNYEKGELVYGTKLEQYSKILNPKELECDVEGLSVALSTDDYHDAIPMKNLIKLRSRSYFSASKFNTEIFRDSERYSARYKSIIDMGRASENFSKDQLRTLLIPDGLDMELEDPDENVLALDEIYINAKGEILPNCDLSYDSQNEYVLGSVLEPNWVEKLYTKMTNKSE